MYTNWKLGVWLECCSTVSLYDLVTKVDTIIDAVLTINISWNIPYELLQRLLRYKANLQGPPGKEGSTEALLATVLLHLHLVAPRTLNPST